jgi:hypothetical protein
MANGLESEANSAAVELLPIPAEFVFDVALDSDKEIAWRVERRPIGTKNNA